MNDEQWPRYQPDETPDREPTPARRSAPSVAKVLVIGIPLVVVTFITLVVLGLLGIGPWAAPDVLSEKGIADLTADVEERTGDSLVFSVTLYPENASLDVPVDSTSQREESLTWDGNLDEIDIKGTSSHERLDLDDLDAAVIASLVDEAKAMIEDPESWYVSVSGLPIDEATTDDGNEEVLLRVYASNEFGESVTLTATLDGTVTDRYQSDA